MVAYVDDYRVPATVGRHDTRWSHLWADSQAELHTFAGRLGLRRSYFQPGQPRAGRPSWTWHYDVTDAKREQALQLGAQPVPWRDSPRMMRAREATAADRAAGLLWKQGEYGAAADLIAQARELDPARADLWAEREAAIARSIGGTLVTPKAEPDASTTREPGNELERQLAERGIAPDDPAMKTWRTWNALCYQRRDAGLEAGQ
jgi:hypothetical protein